jgi:hypothetical protein
MAHAPLDFVDYRLELALYLIQISLLNHSSSHPLRPGGKVSTLEQSAL